MGDVIAFPAKAKTIDEAIIELARMISSNNGASEEDTSFMEAEAKEIRANYFPKTKIEVSITLADSPERVEQIRKIINEAVESLRNDLESDQLRMAAEIMTLKLMLRRRG